MGEYDPTKRIKRVYDEAFIVVLRMVKRSRFYQTSPLSDQNCNECVHLYNRLYLMILTMYSLRTNGEKLGTENISWAIQTMIGVCLCLQPKRTTEHSGVETQFILTAFQDVSWALLPICDDPWEASRASVYTCHVPLNWESYRSVQAASSTCEWQD